MEPYEANKVEVLKGVGLEVSNCSLNLPSFESVKIAIYRWPESVLAISSLQVPGSKKQDAPVREDAVSPPLSWIYGPQNFGPPVLKAGKYATADTENSVNLSEKLQSR